MRIRITAVGIAFLVSTMIVSVAESATKDDAVSLVKTAVAAIKADGPEKGYAEINTPGGKFLNGELYALVLGFDGIALAHAANQKLVGKDMIDVQDVDGKYFAKDMIENGRKQASFWDEYKFSNPTTKMNQVKDMYCERLNETVVCAGVYRP